MKSRHANVILESEGMFRTMLENIRLSAVMFDMQGTIIFSNDFFLQLTSWQKEEVMGKNYFEVFIPLQERIGLQKRFDAIPSFEGTPTFYHFDKIQTHQGEERLIAWNTTLLRDSQGNPTYLTCIGDDVTEERKAEEKLRQSEERYRDLFENANDLIQSVGSDGKFIYTNRAWQDALGYDEAEIPNLTISEIIHQDHFQQCLIVMQKVLNVGNVTGIESVFVTKDGRKIQVEGNISCKAQDGKLISTRGIFRDITERKLAEEAVKESEERYRTLFEKTANPILVIDKYGKYIDGNQAAADFLECS